MHDRHGNEIEVGDIVAGPGYNIGYDVVGPVVAVSRTTDACGVHVGFARKIQLWRTSDMTDVEVGQAGTYYVDVEHGTASAFEIVRTFNARTLECGPYAGQPSQHAARKAFEATQAEIERACGIDRTPAEVEAGADRLPGEEV